MQRSWKMRWAFHSVPARRSGTEETVLPRSFDTCPRVPHNMRAAIGPTAVV